MEQLLEAAAVAGYEEILPCVERVFTDYKVKDFHDLENLPGSMRGRTRLCGRDIYKFIQDVKEALLALISISQVVGHDQSLDEEE